MKVLDNLYVLCLNPDGAVRHRYLREIVRHVIPLAEDVVPSLVGTVRALVDEADRLGYVRIDAGRTAFPYPSASGTQSEVNRR